MKVKFSTYFEIRRRIKQIRGLKYTDPAFWAGIGALIVSVIPVIASFFSVSVAIFATAGMHLLEIAMGVGH